MSDNRRQTRVLVTGAGGFIGHHLVKYLKAQGYWVRGVDKKLPEYEPSAADEFEVLDLRKFDNCLLATRGIAEVYGLAAEMGGIGFIEHNKAVIMRDSALINLHMLEAARVNGATRYLFTSSACIYPGYLQKSAEVTPLKEEDAYPADAEDGYGWEKLFTERQCRHYREDFGLETRIVRFHNIFGPLGTYDGGREKSPAAICRKIALAPDGGTIEVWGDGEQTRSYCFVEDTVEGIHRLMRSDYPHPLNLGQDRMVTINELVDMVAKIAGKTIKREHNLSAPQGVRGRNSDNTKLREVLGWEPRISLEEGLRRTYAWIYGELAKRPETYTVQPPAPDGVTGASGAGSNGGAKAGAKGASKTARAEREVVLASSPDVAADERAQEETDPPRPHGDKLESLIPRDGDEGAARAAATSA